jgi:hypothetical protein
VLDEQLAASMQALDCIVSNPPYLNADDMQHLQTEVTFEPALALDGGADGLHFYRNITRIWKNTLKTGGLLAFEAGIGQADPISEILAENGLTGIETVRTSYYGCGYGEIYDPKNIHASNKETPIDGKFENTKVGMGSQDNRMGPELGCAYKLKEYASEENPIYFIKAGVSGSGFAQTGSNAINWNIEEAPNLYDKHLKPYTQNCLDLIEAEAGVKPIIRGFLWMQGESDTEQKKIDAYERRFDAFVGKLKEDFASYAKEGDGSNIAVIDACIYDGPNTAWGAQTSVNLNNLKMEMAETHENQYCINTSCKLEGGMELKVGNPGGDSMHYNTESSFRLGMAFADVIIDNNLLG